MDARNSHYLRDVLRMKVGAELELFDGAGQTAMGRIVEINSQSVSVEAEAPRLRIARGFHWSIASAVPKGNRADWMVEKLSEFGADEWIPLMTERSVVHPEGTGKNQRWQRIAEESARQCRRAGVMQVGSLTSLTEMIQNAVGENRIGFCLDPTGSPISQALADWKIEQRAIFFVGPEGGWSEKELEQMELAGIEKFALATNILRIETAAIAVAAIAQIKR